MSVRTRLERLERVTLSDKPQWLEFTVYRADKEGQPLSGLRVGQLCHFPHEGEAWEVFYRRVVAMYQTASASLFICFAVYERTA
jgi:hypothetical protein